MRQVKKKEIYDMIFEQNSMRGIKIHRYGKKLFFFFLLLSSFFFYRISRKMVCSYFWRYIAAKPEATEIDVRT